jgi:hypothetical protein
MFDLSKIEDVCESESLGVVDRLSMPSGAPVTIPGISGALLHPHDVVPVYQSSGVVRLYIGSTTAGDPAVEAGGIGIVDVDYTTPESCAVEVEEYWPYDADRREPARQIKSTTHDAYPWWYRQTHTAAPFFCGSVVNSNFVVDDHYVVTADEFFGTKYNAHNKGMMNSVIPTVEEIARQVDRLVSF